ncbi:MAG: ABC transporter ATP-binding protein [Phycisphaeraceae bacterium]|nr:ABC transporter ATP-binding protein [Phycisphaeraceae bacterium]
MNTHAIIPRPTQGPTHPDGAARAGTTLIRCERLTKSYAKGGGSITPLQELDLEVPAGDFLALMGPSGSGKTTLLNLIAGIDRPTAGRLLVGGTDLGKLSRGRLADWRSRHVGYVFQLYNLVPVLTAYENVELPLLLHGLTASRRHEMVSTALELVGIADRHDHFPRQLSGGQEQRVAIARAIVTDPTIIVADEPTGDLDSDSASAIMDLLSRLCTELGKTLIIVTHDARCAGFARRTLRLDKGRLVRTESLAERGATARPEVPTA